jgi:hypothetical protein
MNASATTIRRDPSEVVSAFQRLYQSLGPGAVAFEPLAEVYRNDLLFEDPFHRIEGLDALHEYFDALYRNVRSIRFVFHQHWMTADDAMLTWTMHLAHPRLNGGKPIAVEGCSMIRFDHRIFYHRDYFDGGQLLYENVPILGKVIRKLKQGLV